MFYNAQRHISRMRIISLASERCRSNLKYVSFNLILRIVILNTSSKLFRSEHHVEYLRWLSQYCFRTQYNTIQYIAVFNLLQQQQVWNLEKTLNTASYGVSITNITVNRDSVITAIVHLTVVDIASQWGIVVISGNHAC